MEAERSKGSQPSWCPNTDPLPGFDNRGLGAGTSLFSYLASNCPRRYPSSPQHVFISYPRQSWAPAPTSKFEAAQALRPSHQQSTSVHFFRCRRHLRTEISQARQWVAVCPVLRDIADVVTKRLSLGMCRGSCGDGWPLASG